MADAKKVKIGGIWYNVKDETARNGLAGKVNKSGDTMTGSLTISKDPDPTIQWFESDDSKGRIYFRDNNFCLFEYPSDQQQYGEGYSLPKANTGLARTMWYNILTTKNLDTTPTAGSANPVTSGGVKTALDSMKILFFANQSVTVAKSAQILRIPASGTNDLITTNTVVLSCEFAYPQYILDYVSWESFSGYVTITGTCLAATNATVILGCKSN